MNFMLAKVISLSLLLSSCIFAQHLGYEWIEPGRTYKKLLVPEDGIYRIYPAQLSLPPGVNPQNIYLYFRGQEVPFFLNNTGNLNEWDAGDYIEFYAQQNDGKIEAGMYRNPYTFLTDPSLQPDSLFSLFSDTSAYFLTWKETPSAKAQVYNNPTYTGTQNTYIEALKRIPFHSYFFKGAGPGISTGLGFFKNPTWTTAEGYTSPYINSSFSQSFSLNKFLNVGKNVRVKWRTAGIGYQNAEYTNHAAQVNINGNVTNIQRQGIFIQTFETSVPPTANIHFSLNVSEGNFLLTWIHAFYTRSTDLTGEPELKFLINNTTGQEFWIEFTNVPFNNSFDNLVLWDITSHTKIVGTRNGNSVKVRFPKFAGTHEFFLIMESQIKTPIIKDANISYLNSPTNDYDFIIITSQDLKPSALEYKTYRDTNTVNPQKTLVVTNEEIYDEFGYGSPSPLAIRNFLQTAHSRWNSPPKFVLLWGKGSFAPRTENFIKVLTWGYPASDLLYVSYWDDNSPDFNPVLPIGRVNIYDNDEGRLYLNKVIEYEHAPFEEWCKKGVHLGGGINASEQSAISYFLVRAQAIFESNPYLGDIFYKQKNTSNINQSYVDTIKGAINNGVIIINFFGHSSTNIYDADIGYPYEYDNTDGKYPVVLGNGCYGGDFAISWKSFAEYWVNGVEERGGIAFIGTSTTGYLGKLGEWMKHLYESMFRDSIGAHLGEQHANALKKWIATAYSSYFTSYHFLMMHTLTTNLQGDPSVRLKSPTLPDLTWDNKSFSIQPTNLTAQTDTLTLQATIKNIGLAFQDSFYVSVEQQVTGRGLYRHFGHFPFPAFSRADTTIKIKIPSLGTNIAGQNIFTLTVDSKQEITEQREDNNILTTEIYIPTNLPVTIYPYPYAIVNQNAIELKAGTYDPQITTPVNYIFEIDTAYDFSSPFKQTSGIVQGNTLLATWKLPFLLENNKVYYWRVRLTNETRWASASFKYIQGPKIGFAQAKPPQFLEGNKTSIEYSAPSFQWNFTSRSHFLKIDNTLTRTRISYDNVFLDEYFAIWWPSVRIVYTIIDGKSMQPITHHPDYGSIDIIFDGEDLNRLGTIIQSMKQGDYLILVGINSPNLSQITASTWNALAQIGVSNYLKQNLNTQAFSIVGKKGGTALEKYNPPYLETFLYERTTEGIVESPILGPATEWNDLIWNWKSIDPNALSDSIELEIIGITQTGQEVSLLNIPNKGTFNIASINASQYPFLKVRASLKDEYYRTPPNIEHWHLYYIPAPEAMINPYEHWSFHRDTLIQGETVSLEVMATNISAFDMDSLLVKYEILKPDNSRLLIGTKRYAPLKSFSDLIISYDFSTQNLSGENLLIITINPNFDQPEQSLHNNVYTYKFYVIEDKINPILDVTVDGKHILDGDIVSPHPEILIQLNDENPYLLIDDTSAIDVYFKNAYDLNPAPRVSYSSGKLRFVPATTSDNKAQVFFYPGHLEDGEYLLEVQGKDKRENPSGKTNYAVRFQVINESTITDVVNYPNPFSTSTRFVYTLTGGVLPEVFKIYIYTVSGRLVKVIDLMETGDVRIGQNITNYAWDGRDEQGDLLANGVYLYKVVIKMPGESSLKKKDKDTSEYFKNGFGKMYIMR